MNYPTRLLRMEVRHGDYLPVAISPYYCLWAESLEEDNNDDVLEKLNKIELQLKELSQIIENRGKIGEE